MHAAFDQLRALVRSSRTVLLTGPDSPDGDSIGACLSLARVLRALEPGVDVRVAGRPGFRYAFLPGAQAMVPEEAVAAVDGVVVMDGDRRRLAPAVAAAFDGARWTAIVDHHRSTDPSVYTVAIFDPAAESTCGLVYTMARHWGVPVDRDLAATLYTGVIFDTGGFRYSNTGPETHRMAAELLETGIDHAQVALRVLAERRPQGLRLLAALLARTTFEAGGRVVMASCPLALMAGLGADDGDLEGAVDHLQHTDGVELAAILVERPNGRVKVSLRSRGRVDVAELARALHDGGGGHAKAAGVALAGGLDPVTDAVRARLVAAVGG